MGVDFVHHARAVQAQDLRQRVGDARAAVAHVKVHPVDGGGGHAHQHLARRAHRLRALAHLDDLVAAVAVQPGSLHSMARADCARSRSWNFWILPVEVLGMGSKRISRGTL